MSLNVSLPNGFTNVTTATAPVPLMQVDGLNRKIIGPASILLTARKDKATENTGDVYVGDRTTQSQVLTPGQALSLQLEPGESIDLAGLFVDAANDGDGVSYLIKRS